MEDPTFKPLVLPILSEALAIVLNTENDGTADETFFADMSAAMEVLNRQHFISRGERNDASEEVGQSGFAFINILLPPLLEYAVQNLGSHKILRMMARDGDSLMKIVQIGVLLYEYVIKPIYHSSRELYQAVRVLVSFTPEQLAQYGSLGDKCIERDDFRCAIGGMLDMPSAFGRGEDQQITENPEAYTLTECCHILPPFLSDCFAAQGNVTWLGVCLCIPGLQKQLQDFRNQMANGLECEYARNGITMAPTLCRAFRAMRWSLKPTRTEGVYEPRVYEGTSETDDLRAIFSSISTVTLPPQGKDGIPGPDPTLIKAHYHIAEMVNRVYIPSLRQFPGDAAAVMVVGEYETRLS
ncbi:hypothetical protein B0H66DRAFT_642801 [Apodospora peruviana]|uniref:HNH nuclease domain-containing protein n=1 Tax=Apodospora peruviana TaxID=516989 RepID=A0AAE0HZP7_9PEZI|nr:hypothetical protein B0H66DRAFT_642801 [Apodospora peruviana]